MMPAMRFRFGDFEADRAAYRVARRSVPLDLTPKLLDLLFCLLEHPGDLVTKEALLDAVWPGANVTENAMAQAISDLREALGDDAASPTYIKTISRRGYRFIAPVERIEAAKTGPATPDTAAGPPGHAKDQRDAVTAGPAARTLAVTDFANLTGDPDVAWLGAGIAETVTSDLAALEGFRVIDRWRVVDAARRSAASTSAPAGAATAGTGAAASSASALDIARALDASLVVTGGFQRRGTQIRVTARIFDVASGDATADVKVDGQLDNVFALQDEIAREFARVLGVQSGRTAARPGVRETGSLEAYRAFVEGSLEIESLDVTHNAAAIRDFERAIDLDPEYAIAYAGLANAEFIAYEHTRATESPNLAALRSGIEHARYAVHLDPGLAEGHATLSFLLTSARQFDEARRAAQQAVAIEPDNWRHQYRLGHALWGAARLRAFERTLALYPQFAYARFEMAMVHVARGRFDMALDLVQRGAGDQDRQTRSLDRFPAVGFHWLLGAMRAAGGDLTGARAAFDRELEQADERRLYRTEYAAAALVGRGHICLHLGEIDDAEQAFTAALKYLPRQPQALVGLATARGRAGHAGAVAHAGDARAAIAALNTRERASEWLYATAAAAAAGDDASAATAALDRLLDIAPSSYLGWTLPVDPVFLSLHGAPSFAAVLARLAERAQ
jgi:DNA-binding winged helix-turn-helix (wHTH) protein/tetratricopeptide (TPR) repeat protein